MNIIACYNIKGGVGKTAAAVNLACLAAQEGARTLLWDLDPQGASSFYYRCKTDASTPFAAPQRKERSIASHIQPSTYDKLDLLPANASGDSFGLLAGNRSPGERKLSKLLQGVMGRYDYIFLDCPPDLSLLRENVFHSSDILLVPTIPTPLSLRTLQQIIGFKAEDPQIFPRLMTFFSMVDRRKTMHRLIIDRPPKLDAHVLGSAIPYASEVERMGVERKPLVNFARSNRAAKAYLTLWLELKAQLSPSVNRSQPHHYQRTPEWR